MLTFYRGFFLGGIFLLILSYEKNEGKGSSFPCPRHKGV